MFENLSQQQQKEIFADASTAYRTFVENTPEWEPYKTTKAIEENNMTVLADWIGKNLPSRLLDGTKWGSWALAFQNCRATLKADSNFVSREFEDRVRAMSVTEIKQAMKSERGFSESYLKLQSKRGVR